jgi:hypothetical protein
MLTMIYMTRVQNMSFFLLKVNNPSVRHPVWPPSGTPCGPHLAPCLAFVELPLGTPSGPHPDPVWPRSGPCRAPCLASSAPLSGPPSGLVWPPVWLLRPAPSGPLFGRSQGYKFAQICITHCPSCIASLKTLASLLWIHCVRPIVQGGFNFPILDYHDLQDNMHDQFHVFIFFSSSI